jgi:histidine kinase
MNWLSAVRSHLGWKLFLSYLVVILAGVIVLASSVELFIPSAFDRHMADMGPMMETMMGASYSSIDTDLFAGFRAGVNEALTLAALAAFAVAVLVSFFVSRQVVAPVREMMAASQNIAEGHYSERIRLTGDASKGELDELAQLALSFNQMADRLEQTETMRRQLIGDVTHELRTPLTVIKGSMEGLIDGVLPAEDATYQQIYREADRLQKLVDDLQELSRVEAGAYELNLHPLSVSELVKATAAQLDRQFEEKGVTLDTNLSTDLPLVSGDKDRLGQVLLNLVGNALQYTPPAGRVQISARQQGSEVHVAVSDTGVGISPEHLPHLFTRFFRVDRSRSRAGGGSGIGLTIARHLVEANGGRIWVESPGLGKGSTFTFTLPVDKT